VGHLIITEKLLSREGITTRGEIKKYQGVTGSILYTALITHPNVAFAVSRLTRFNHNPGPKHYRAVERVLNYLQETANYILQLGGGETFKTYSNTSFADNTLDRKSLQDMITVLWKEVVAWRACKQTTVTTSTTEAELLALEFTAKETIYISRLLKSLGEE
jgi:hypothetical protein